MRNCLSFTYFLKHLHNECLHGVITSHNHRCTQLWPLLGWISCMFSSTLLQTVVESPVLSITPPSLTMAASSPPSFSAWLMGKHCLFPESSFSATSFSKRAEWSSLSRTGSLWSMSQTSRPGCGGLLRWNVVLWKHTSTSCETGD